MNLQDAIAALSRFWAAEGCLVLPPCELEVPGGILHPQAFFRLLDPEPWRAAYLQPVRRPLDGRYGRHPYRLARHLQFQVVVKAPGGDLRDLYLRSLEELGLELADHDLRFAEWSWEAFSIDALGLGWRVLVDGLSVTRMTFLQRLAGRELDPVAVEISYGLERLVMALTQENDVFRLPWAEGGPEYGDLARRDEIELSRYAVEVADADVLERRLEILEEQARQALDADLVRLAYETAVESLPTIDLLDARGRLSIRGREERLARVRDLVGAVAEPVAAETVPAETVPAETVPAETVPAESADGEVTEHKRPKRKRVKRKVTKRKRAKRKTPEREKEEDT